MAENSVDLSCQQNSNHEETTEKGNRDKSKVEESSENDDSIHELLQDLSNFTPTKILRNNIMHKQIAVLGKFKESEEDVLVVLEKKQFSDDQSLLTKRLFNKETTTTKLYRNDIYRGYDFFPGTEYSGLSATITFPATSKHIQKFLPPELHLVEESPDIYNNVTLPNILSQQLSLQWVDNILDGTAEVDRVIFNDEDPETGFVLVKDLKWKDDLSSLYLIAITRKKLKSIRDLTDSHLPLLKNIKEAGVKAIREKYNIPLDQLRIYFHYLPSYYHLHVHFTVPTFENTGIYVDRAHLLSTVINNIEMVPDYYQKATLTFRIHKNTEYKPYEDYINQKQDEPPTKRQKLETE